VIFNIQRDDGGRLRIEKNLGDLPVMVSEANPASGPMLRMGKHASAGIVSCSLWRLVEI
jgi:hypothetical protein